MAIELIGKYLEAIATVLAIVYAVDYGSDGDFDLPCKEQSWKQLVKKSWILRKLYRKVK